jgi:glycosyltransferase involved in cell wall biosynthesis
MSGGAEAHVRGLVAALRESGHEAEIASIPFKWYPPNELVHQMGMWRSVDLTESNGEPIDMVIALKFPAYLVPHPNKVVWLIHQHRTAYELWDDPRFGDIAPYPDGPAVRRLIHNADRLGLGEAVRLFANSENVRGRLERSIGLDAEVLYHRSPLTDRLLSEEPREHGDEVLFPSRFDRLKRQGLAVDAMKHVRTDVRLTLVGAGAERDTIAKRIAEAGLTERVTIHDRVPDDQLVELYVSSLAVYFGPLDEDYGYVTIEGMAAARPLIVTSDSGGPLEFVRDGENGVIVEPDPEEIAAAFDRLYEDRRLAGQLGSAGRSFVSERIPVWPDVVRRLLG